MKTLILIITILLLTGCVKKFTKDGIEYKVKTRCLKDTSYTTFEYHYGYWMGKWKYHYGPNTHYECLEYKTDTLQVK